MYRLDHGKNEYEGMLDYLMQRRSGASAWESVRPVPGANDEGILNCVYVESRGLTEVTTGEGSAFKQE